MKRAVSILAAAALAVSVISPLSAFAADTGLETAIGEARTRIEIPAEYSQFESSVNQDGLMTSYNLNWSTEGDSYEGARTIRVTVNSKGDITNYNTGWYDRDDSMKLAKYNGQQLKDIAAAWIEKVNPSWVAELDIDGAEAPVEKGVFESDASVVFQRKVNGIPFCDNYVSFSLDKQTGEVTHMYARWTYAEGMPNGSTGISIEDAQKKFAQYSPMELKYFSGEDDKQYLAYVPTRAEVMLRAADGEEVTFQRGVYTNEASEDAAEPMAMAMADRGVSGGGSAKSNYQMTAEEQMNVSQMENLIAVEEAEKALKAMPELGIEDYTLSSSNYSRYGEEGKYRYELRMELRKGDDESMSTAYATVDAEDGSLLNYSHYAENDYRSSYVPGEEKAVVTPAQAQTLAKEFAAKAAPAELAQTKARENENSAEEYGVNFVRYANDIICESNSINVRINPQTGKVRSFFKEWNKDYVFESTDGIIGAAKAAEELFRQAGLTQKYVDLNKMMYGKKPADPCLVYVLNEQKPNRVSAKTGKLLSYDGSEYKENTPASSEITDIAGHYGETAIRVLLDNGVIETEAGQTEFRPDDFITQEELLGFVSRLVGGVMPLARAEIYDIAARNQIVLAEEKNPEKIAVREEAVKYIIRALGYDKVAALPDIFNCGFADRDSITDGAEGYVAIAKGFGIVHGDEANNFNPQENVTRADAAIMIFNYLNR